MPGNKLIIVRHHSQWAAGTCVLLEAGIPSLAGMAVTEARDPGMVPSTHICQIQLREETV
jgi:hypothetical protein